MKKKRKNQNRKLKITGVLILFVIFLSSMVAVSASVENGWLDWNGQSELDEAKALVIQLVSDVNTLDGQVTTLTSELATANAMLLEIETQVNEWLVANGIDAPYTEADINSDGEVTILEKLTYLEATTNTQHGHIITLILENAELQAEIDDINNALDDVINNNTDIVLTGTETAEEKIALINNYIDSLQNQIEALTDERDWLFTELTTANAAAVQFKTDICAEIDNLPANLRGNYIIWCPTE